MNPGAAGQPDSPIEVYLDELLTAASGMPPRRVRGLLAEADAHLRDDAAAARRGGLSAIDAETRAVARFGPASVLVAADQSESVTPIGVFLRQVLLTGLLLGGVGALAVGASGVLALFIWIFSGTRVLVGVPSAHVLSAANCARWLAGNPGASSCRAAAVDDWATETVVYRIVLGVLGLLALAAFVWVRRHRRLPYGATLLPTVGDTVATTAFGAAGVWTLGMGIDAIVQSSGAGSGTWLSAAPIALGLAAFYAVRLTARVRHRVA